MHVVVLGVSQGISFETGEGYNHLTLLLPNGSKIKASVSDEAVTELTALFIQGGGAAVETAMARANQPPADTEVEELSHPPVSSYARLGEIATPAKTSSYVPVNLSDGSTGEDEEVVSTFGGDVHDPMLDAVGMQLQQAESKMARAIGDTSALSQASISSIVARIATPEPVMPVPNLMSKPVKAQPRPTVQKDDAGNPILSGPGFIDPRSLMGGNVDGEEDVGQR